MRSSTAPDDSKKPTAWLIGGGVAVALLVLSVIAVGWQSTTEPGPALWTETDLAPLPSKDANGWYTAEAGRAAFPARGDLIGVDVAHTVANTGSFDAITVDPSLLDHGQNAKAKKVCDDLLGKPLLIDACEPNMLVDCPNMVVFTCLQLDAARTAIAFRDDDAKAASARLRDQLSQVQSFGESARTAVGYVVAANSARALLDIAKVAVTSGKAPELKRAIDTTGLRKIDGKNAMKGEYVMTRRLFDDTFHGSAAADLGPNRLLLDARATMDEIDVQYKAVFDGKPVPQADRSTWMFWHNRTGKILLDLGGAEMQLAPILKTRDELFASLDAFDKLE